MFRYAASLPAEVARQLQAAPAGPAAADIVWAAADVLITAAEVTGSPDLARAADRFARAARASWARIPAPSVPGAGLRIAAYLLAGCRPGGHRRSAARMALITALAGTARALAGLRAAQQRLLQATAARGAATVLAASTAPGPGPRPGRDWPPPARPARR